MKIGIMTMHRVPNYGSIMQALSLKRMIESLGHQVCFVDYHIQPDIENKENWREGIVCWLKNQKRAFYGTTLGKHPIWGADNKLLDVAEKYEYRTKVDVLVIGSDEVFNCLQPGKNIGYSPELFGKHNRAKKVITYAASFGNTTINGLSKHGVDGEIGALLCQMAAISVRDKNSESIVQELCSCSPSLHLDPVLVGDLEKEQWPLPELDDYVIMYGYEKRFTEEECRQILQFAHDRGKTAVALGEDQVLRDKHILCKPEEIFGYFAKADYVFTDTFHGTIFSVITHRPFLTVTRPGQMGNSQKLGSLAETLGIRDRLVESFAAADKQMNMPIDFEGIDRLRAQEKKKTMDYLGTNLSI